MNFDKFCKHEEKRIAKYAWAVAKEIRDHLDDTPAMGEYVKSFLAEEDDRGFFHSHDHLKLFIHNRNKKQQQNVPGYYHFKKIELFIDNHYQIGELYQEFIKEGCKKTAGDISDFCNSCTWVGPHMDRIPRPELDPENPGHYKNVFQTLGINGKQRQVDDFLLKELFAEGNISSNSHLEIEKFCEEFAVEKCHAVDYVKHLELLKFRKEKRKESRDQENN